MADMAGARLQFHEALGSALHIADLGLANSLAKIASGLEELTHGRKASARLQFHEAIRAGMSIPGASASTAVMKIAAGLELMV